MKIFRLLVIILILGNAAAAQQFSILGKVVDSATKQPLQGASAFAQNTTYGTITNADGNFFLRFPNGGYDLVISYTGFEKQMMRVSNTTITGDTVVIELAKQDQSMSEVAVVQSNEVENGLEKYGKFFIDQFIGTTPNADACIIRNPETLRFFYTKNNKRHRLKVTSREDLIIENQNLGYRIRYQLDSFSYDYNSNISQYTGSPFFEQLDSTDEVKEEWMKNRAKTYLGSRLHFMRSLYDSTVMEEGFTVEKMDDRNSKYTKGVAIENLYDSLLYGADSSIVEIQWNGLYRIGYKRVFPDKKFLQEYKLPANTKVQMTLVSVDNGFVIEQNGYFYEQYDVINSGYWAWKKLAELLPYDYEYE